MNKNVLKFTSNNIYIRPIKLEDSVGPYPEWLNDISINQYLESRFMKWDEENTREYIKEIIRNNNEKMFAICMKNDDSHIGNIKIGSINWQHFFGDIGIIIGDRKQWGKKRAQEAIDLICTYGFDNLKLNKLTAGCYAENIGSLKAFEAVGFQQEGRILKKYLTHNGYTDHLILGLLQKDFKKFQSN